MSGDPKSNDHNPLKSKTQKDEETQPDKDASHKCKHPSHQNYFNSADLMNLMPSEYWANYIRDKRFEKGSDEVLNTEEAYRAINEVFIVRLQELENRAPNILEAKVETYKDWISVQQRINQNLLNDFDNFEKTFKDHLESQEMQSNYSFRRDIATLVKLIKQAFHYNNWNLAGFKFESMTPAFVMGLDENNSSDMETLEKLMKGEYKSKTEENDVRQKRSTTDVNVMALAVEVAEKHDEINKLKQQVCALEDEIQNAQKKIQLKDVVIKDLRLDLKNVNKSLVQEHVINSTEATSIKEGQLTTKENVTEDSMMSQSTVNNNKKVNVPKDSKFSGMAENLDLVKNQLEEILSQTNWQKECSTNEADCLKKVFMKLEKDKNEAQERLKKLKESLSEIVLPSESEDKNLIMSNDEFLIRAVQAHIESINMSHKELSGQVQKLLIEKGSTVGKLEALNNINHLNCEALKQLADLLSSLTNEPICYEDIYDSNSKKNNPFCRSIGRIHSKLTKQIDELTEALAAEKEKYRKKEQEIYELEKTQDETSSSKLCCITRSSVRVPQRTNTEQLPTIAPRPHPRQKSKKLERKN